MLKNKNGLDEMQRQRRDRIGNQTFVLMFYALMIDCGLYGYGIRWVRYPVNVMAIIIACMITYLIRVIALDAYLPPRAQNRKTISLLFMAVVFSTAAAIAVSNLFGPPPAQSAGNIDDNSAIVLMIISAVGLISTLIVAVTVIRRANRKDDEDQ